jgi:hypothetical protein
VGRALRWLRRAYATAARRPAASADIDL